MHPLDELKTWVGFGAADEARLAALWPHAAPRLERVIDAFYAPILAAPKARAVLSDDAQVVRLRATLATWLRDLLQGPHDIAYYERRKRIGRIHMRVDLPSRFMPVAVAAVRNELAAIARESLSSDEAWAATASVERITAIDLAIMTSTYVEEREVVELSALRDLIVSHIPVTVLVIDNEGRVAAATRPAARLVGDAPIVGRPWEDALPQALIEAADLRGQLDRAKRLGRDITLHRVDAEIGGVGRSFRMTVVPLEHPLAAALLHLEELTEAVDTEARLRRAETMARLGEMSAAVAHELRNPLAGVIAGLQLVGKGVPAHDPRRVVMDKVEEQIFRLNSLVSDLLAFARPGMPEARVVDLAEAASRAVDEIRRLHPGPVYTVSGAGEATADAGHVHQILLQLVENAAQAAPGGQVWVEAAPGRVTVRDDGPGVASVDRERIFEPFFTTRTRGTGLGLPIAQRMALAMGGDLALSRSGTPGATFVLTLPRAAAP